MGFIVESALDNGYPKTVFNILDGQIVLVALPFYNSISCGIGKRKDLGSLIIDKIGA
jgi:hypothetical protein